MERRAWKGQQRMANFNEDDEDDHLPDKLFPNKIDTITATQNSQIDTLTFT